MKLGLLDILTIIFVLLKVFNVITWSWWVVFLPTILEIAIFLIVFLIGCFLD